MDETLSGDELRRIITSFLSDLMYRAWLLICHGIHKTIDI